MCVHVCGIPKSLPVRIYTCVYTDVVLTYGHNSEKNVRARAKPGNWCSLGWTVVYLARQWNSDFTLDLNQFHDATRLCV